MNSGNWMTVLSIALSLTTVVGGWVLTHILTELRAARAQIETQRDTIGDLRAQRDRLLVTAEVQDRFFANVPIKPPAKE